MKVVAKNRRARFDFEITETIEAGIRLTGQEVKSCRLGNINLAGAYVSLIDGTPTLKNAKISAYKYASGLADYNPQQDRVLLLKKSEIERLSSAVGEKGITVIPLEVLSGRVVKLLLGVGRGRKKFDKRQKIREREVAKKLKKGEEY